MGGLLLVGIGQQPGHRSPTSGEVRLHGPDGRLHLRCHLGDAEIVEVVQHDGPALVGTVSGNPAVLTFVASMIRGKPWG